MQLVHLGEQRDEVHRAIGKYFVDFSVLVQVMREFVMRQVTPNQDEEPRRVLRLAMGGMAAQDAANAFFAMCREVAAPAFDKKDADIERCLRDTINGEIRWRNIVAHGDWFVAEWESGEVATPQAPPAWLLKVQPHSSSQPVREEELTIAQIVSYGLRVEQYQRFVWEFGMICTRTIDYDPQRRGTGIRVSDAFEVVGSGDDRHVQFRQRNTPELWPNSPG